MNLKCPKCGTTLSTGAAIAGSATFFCTNIDCPGRFKSIPDPTPKPEEEKDDQA